MANSIVNDKSKAFALSIIQLYQWLTECAPEREYVLSKQLLRSGTSIGANVREALKAQSKRDYVSKMNIALKESNESEYWLELLSESGYIPQKERDNYLLDCQELTKILTSIVKTVKENIASEQLKQANKTNS